MELSNWGLKKRAAYLEGILSILSNTLLFFLKYHVGVLFNSIAVVADSFHTLSDSLTSVVLIMGYKIADRPPDKEHPFGHGRAESIGGLVIGVLLGVIAYDFTISSYEKLLSGISLIYSGLLVLVLSISTGIKLAMTVWAYKLGTRHSSQPIKADALHHASDTFASGLLTLTIYMGRDYWWLDGALGICVSLLIFATAGKVLYEASSEVLGKAPRKIELDRLITVIGEVYRKPAEVHHVHFHRYGEHVEVTLHINLPGSITLKEAHDVATAIENGIREKLGYEVTVHVEPSERVEGHVD